MSGKIMGQVYDLDLTHSQQSVLLAYADHADHTGGNVRPSIGLIAWKTGYSTRQVQRITQSLVKAGLLLVVARREDAPTEYRVNLAAGKVKPPYEGRKSLDRRRQEATGGDTMTPPPDAVTPPVTSENVTPPMTLSCHPPHDTIVSPKPSLQPSLQPSEMAGADAPPSPPETSPSQTSKPKRSRKSAVAKADDVSVPPPAPPAAPEQVAADVAAFDALESAAAAPSAPLDWSKWPMLHRERQADLMRRAIAEVCFGDSTSTDPATWRAWDRPDVQPFHSEIRGHAKDLLSQQWDAPITALEVFQTFQRAGLWGHKWMAWSSGEYTRPTPGAVAKYVRSLHLIADAPSKFLAVLAVPSDPADAVRRAIEQNARIAPPPAPVEWPTRRLSRWSGGQSARGNA